MKLIELRKLSLENLNTELISLLREKFNLTIQMRSGKLKQTHRLRKVKKNIVQIKTIIHQKMQGV